MSNIKLKDHYWETEGIYDTAQTATQKAINGEVVESARNIIKVQDTQPTSSYNKIWLPETVGDGVQVPTWAEHQALSNTVSALGTGDITNGSNVSGATATAALNTLNGAITSLGSDDIANDSTNVSGSKVTNALDTLNGALNSNENAIAIVSDNNTHIAITKGQYVFVKNHSTLSGLYVANSNISANGTLSTSNLTAVPNGGFNALNDALSQIGTVIMGSDVTNELRTAQVEEIRTATLTNGTWLLFGYVTFTGYFSQRASIYIQNGSATLAQFNGTGDFGGPVSCFAAFAVNDNLGTKDIKLKIYQTSGVTQYVNAGRLTCVKLK